MPGVLMLEALAQAAAVLSFESLGQDPDKDTIYYIAAADAVRFKRPVEPGDQLMLDVTLDRSKANIFKFTGVGSVGGEIAVEAQITCTMRKVS
jgi:3-hydroxyacyl-[acyl-carrier-protein] dehydratase